MLTSSLHNEKDHLALFVKGDENSFRIIYAHYSPLLLHKLMRMIGDEQIVKDIHQAAFIKLWEYRKRLNPDKGIANLLFRISKNMVIDHYRKTTTENNLKKAFLAQATLFFELDDTDTELEIMSEELHAAIKKLPQKRREIFISCKFQGKTYEQTAAEKGIGIGTVKDHMAKAMRFLKDELGDNLLIILIILSTHSQ